VRHDATMMRDDDPSQQIMIYDERTVYTSHAGHVKRVLIYIQYNTIQLLSSTCLIVALHK